MKGTSELTVNSVASLPRSFPLPLPVRERGLKSIIKENKLSATGLIDPATARKLGKVAGVDALITGTLTPLRDGDVLNLEISISSARIHIC